MEARKLFYETEDILTEHAGRLGFSSAGELVEAFPRLETVTRDTLRPIILSRLKALEGMRAARLSTFSNVVVFRNSRKFG